MLKVADNKKTSIDENNLCDFYDPIECVDCNIKVVPMHQRRWHFKLIESAS